LPTLSIRAADGDKPPVNSPTTTSDWADLAQLPDWGGIWIPKIPDQDAQVRTNPPPWNRKPAAFTGHKAAEERAGRPPPLFVDCLPEVRPSWMLITHNARLAADDHFARDRQDLRDQSSRAGELERGLIGRIDFPVGQLSTCGRQLSRSAGLRGREDAAFASIKGVDLATAGFPRSSV
jgi:hypothetical protein